MEKRGFGKYHGLILSVVFLMLFSLGIGTISYGTTGNDFWRYFDFMILNLLIVTIGMRLVFDLFLKQFLGSSYKKATLISFFIILLYTAFRVIRVIFSEVSTMALIPLVAPLVGFVVFYYISKETRIEKRVKITVFSVLALVFVYSVFCEVNILMELFA